MLKIVLPTLLFFALIADQVESYAQGREVSSDTVQVETSGFKNHSPTRASLFSFVIPGLGQAYNKKYWKIPIIYAGMGIFTYYALEQHQAYAEKKAAYIGRQNGDTTDAFSQPGNFYTDQALLESLDINRRNRDLMIILDAAIYILQIVDASVDAHLFYFDVSDDLSLHYSPSFNYNIPNDAVQVGMSLNLSF